MVVAHFFESGQRRRLRWAESERTANGRRSSAGSTGYIAAIDEKPGGATSARPGRPGFPQREPALPHGEQLESRVREAQGRVILLERGWIAAHCGAGTGCSPANGTPEELRRLARPCVLSIALRLRFYYDLPKRPPKSLGCLRIERNTTY